MLRSFAYLACLAAWSAAAPYSFTDPYGDHTQKAIEFDGNNRFAESLRAFQAAAKFNPSTSTLVNLGVCHMRAASSSSDRADKIENYHAAHAAMGRGGAAAAHSDDERLFEENWKALMQNFELENVPPPPDADTLALDDGYEADPMMCGAPAFEPEVPVAPPRHHRAFLVHQRDVPPAPPLPRIAASSLVKGASAAALRAYADRAEPFILTGAMRDWRALDASASPTDAWAWLASLAARWPKAVTDFYPHNMLSKSRQSPYLTRLGRAVFELKILASPDQGDAGSAFRYEAQRGALNPGRYMHLQLTPAQWANLEDEGDIGKERHWHLHNDEWLDTCMAGAPHLKDEFHYKTHWKIVLAGSRGAGMFNHSDTLLTSSWHAHVAGEKWWYVCGHLTNGTHRCFENTLRPGEILYYGRGWSHETQNLATPTVTITDTAVHARNFEAVTERLHSECSANAMDFKFSGQLCDQLDGCFRTLAKMHGGAVASPQIVSQRDGTSPEGNNYDGRNYITEAE